MKKIAVVVSVLFVCVIFYKYYAFRMFIKGISEIQLLTEFHGSIKTYFYLNNEFPDYFESIIPFFSDQQEIQNLVKNYKLHLTLEEGNLIRIYNEGFDKKNNKEEILLSRNDLTFKNYLFKKKGDILLFEKEYSRDFLIEDLGRFLIFKDGKVIEDQELLNCIKNGLSLLRNDYYETKFGIKETDTVFLFPSNSRRSIIRIGRNGLIDYKNRDVDEFIQELYNKHLGSCIGDRIKIVIPSNLPLKSEEFLTKP